MAKRKVAPARTTRGSEGGSALPATFEATVAELRSIVDDLETQDADLEAAVGHYERGVALQKHAEAQLQAARLRVEELLPDDSTALIDDEEEDEDA
ncbi:MAG: exodeoxyribonuclease VII small subunit [Candidatus Aquidulcis sp.]|jgi:exodeoxyribonuclease VII small subunit|nr:MAG: exodeoxyribonuclease VII small subunit [Candidatus Aquidulcis sp.]